MKEIKTAEIICVGTELLLGDIVNTNAAFLSKKLAELGISVYHQSVVGDNPDRLRSAICTAAKRSQLVIMSGGLGPTYDDITKEIAAEVFGARLVMNDGVLEGIRAYFASTNRQMTKNNEKQALVPEKGIVFKNNYGTAPGIGMTMANGESEAILLPGPPRELEPMFREEVMPYLEQKSGAVIVSRNIHLFGIGESLVETKLKDIMESSFNPTIAPYCIEGEVRLRVTARAENHDVAYELCSTFVEKILKSEVGEFVYGVDCDTLEGALSKKLLSQKKTFACAESCTGGLIAKRITDISGCSRFFLGGAVTYANSAKEDILGVKRETLERFGAVSAETAIEMAIGIRRITGAEIGVSTTGIAGPDGGTPEKPVGTVYVGISSAKGDYAKLLTLSSKRDRAYIRTLAASNAIKLVLDELN